MSLYGYPLQIILLDEPCILYSNDKIKYKNKIIKTPKNTKNIFIFNNRLGYFTEKGIEFENNIIEYYKDNRECDDNLICKDNEYRNNNLINRDNNSINMDTNSMYYNKYNNKYIINNEYFYLIIKNRIMIYKNNLNKMYKEIDLPITETIEYIKFYNKKIIIYYYSEYYSGDFIIDKGKINTIIVIIENKKLKKIVVKGKVRELIFDEKLYILRDKNDILVIDYDNDRYLGVNSGIFGFFKVSLPEFIRKMDILKIGGFKILVVLGDFKMFYYFVNDLKLKLIDNFYSDFWEKYGSDKTMGDQRYKRADDTNDGNINKDDINKNDINEGNVNKDNINKGNINIEVDDLYLIKNNTKIYNLKTGQKDKLHINISSEPINNFYISNNNLYLQNNYNLFHYNYGYINLKLNFKYKNIIETINGIYYNCFYKNLHFNYFYKKNNFCFLICNENCVIFKDNLFFYDFLYVFGNVVFKNNVFFRIYGNELIRDDNILSDFEMFFNENKMNDEEYEKLSMKDDRSSIKEDEKINIENEEKSIKRNKKVIMKDDKSSIKENEKMNMKDEEKNVKKEEMSSRVLKRCSINDDDKNTKDDNRSSIKYTDEDGNNNIRDDKVKLKIYSIESNEKGIESVEVDNIGSIKIDNIGSIEVDNIGNIEGDDIKYKSIDNNLNIINNTNNSINNFFIKMNNLIYQINRIDNEINIFKNRNLIGNILINIKSYCITDSKIYILSKEYIYIIDTQVNKYELDFDKIYCIFDEKWKLIFKKGFQFYEFNEENIFNELKILTENKVEDKIENLFFSDWNKELIEFRGCELENMMVNIEGLMNNIDEYVDNTRKVKEKFKRKWFF